MRYQFSITHVPGKHLTAADTLSRAPVYKPLLQDSGFIQGLPASEHRLEEIKGTSTKMKQAAKL